MILTRKIRLERPHPPILRRAQPTPTTPSHHPPARPQPRLTPRTRPPHAHPRQRLPRRNPRRRHKPERHDHRTRRIEQRSARRHRTADRDRATRTRHDLPLPHHPHAMPDVPPTRHRQVPRVRLRQHPPSLAGDRETGRNEQRHPATGAAATRIRATTRARTSTAVSGLHRPGRTPTGQPGNLGRQRLHTTVVDAGVEVRAPPPRAAAGQAHSAQRRMPRDHVNHWSRCRCAHPPNAASSTRTARCPPSRP